MKSPNPMPPPTAEFSRLRHRLLVPLALIAAASLLGPTTARAGFFDRLKEATNAFQQIKHALGHQPATQPAPATPQPAVTPYRPANQPAPTPPPVTPQPAVASSSRANQPSAANPVGTQSGSVSPASASGNSDPVAVSRKIVGHIQVGGSEFADGASPYTVSLHGAHFASVDRDGSRQVVTVDGVDGPRVDAVLPAYSSITIDQGPLEGVAMSDDGRHYAYVARVGGKVLVFEDGRKILQFPRNTYDGHYHLVFSPHGGVHLLFAAKMLYKDDLELWVDGRPAPYYIAKDQDGYNVAFSADGQHYLYVGRPKHGSSKLVLVVDGRKVGYSVTYIALHDGFEPRFTADGRHVLCDGTTVLLNGKPVVSGNSTESLVIAPRGGSFAGIMEGPKGYGAYLNGTEILATRWTNGSSGVAFPKFSPNGKHLAVACEYGAGNAYVVLDGKKGETYDGIQIGSMKFSADSHRFGYFAEAGGETYAVVDGHEYDPGFAGGGELYFSPEGHHVAVIGEAADGSGYVVYVDGKRVVTKDVYYQPGSFDFDRDGSHWIFSNRGSLVVDGRSLPFEFGGYDYLTGCRFSPDGSELAVAGLYPQHGRGLFLYNCSTRRIRRLTSGGIVGPGGSYVPTVSETGGPDVYPFIFSPDSKHLYYARADSKFVHGYEEAIIYVDGKKTAVQFSISGSFLESLPSAQRAGCWQVGAGDKLHALCRVNNEVERITITPPPSGFVARLSDIDHQDRPARSHGAPTGIHISL